MTTETTEKKYNSNVVFIGEKPFMNYVTGVVMQFTTQNSNEVIVKARGISFCGFCGKELKGE